MLIVGVSKSRLKPQCTRHSRVIVRLQLQRARGVAPVAHEIGGNGKLGYYLGTGSAHAIIGVTSNALVERSRGICVGPDLVSLLQKREREERRAHLRKETF